MISSFLGTAFYLIVELDPLNSFFHHIRVMIYLSRADIRHDKPWSYHTPIIATGTSHRTNLHVSTCILAEQLIYSRQSLLCQFIIPTACHFCCYLLAHLTVRSIHREDITPQRSPSLPGVPPPIHSPIAHCQPSN